MDAPYELSLIDLPDLCLAKILSYLQLDDLMTVAEINPVFRSIANRVHKLGSYWIEYNTKLSNHEYEKMMRNVNCFGEQIRELYITIEEANDILGKISKLIEAASKNCVTLTRFEIVFDGSYGADAIIDKPFLSVTTLNYVQRCTIDGSWTNLNKWFPNVTTFHYSIQRKLENRCLKFAEHIPNLRNFWIGVGREDAWKIFSDFINMNPQITKLELCLGGQSENTFLPLEIDWEKMSISDLSILGGHCELPKSITKLKHLRKIRFCLHVLSGFEDIYIEGLEEIEIRGAWLENTSLLDFTFKHRDLKKLDCYWYKSDIDTHVLQLPKVLSKLEEVCIGVCLRDHYNQQSAQFFSDLTKQFTICCKELRMLSFNNLAFDEINLEKFIANFKGMNQNVVHTHICTPFHTYHYYCQLKLVFCNFSCLE